MSIYGTVGDADTYFTLERLDLDQLWSSASTENKTAALSMATRAIDNLDFQGCKYDENQELEFPRGTDTTVPIAIKRATYECAFSILDGVDLDFEAETLQETGAQLGPARSDKTTVFIPEYRVNGIPSAVAWKMLLPYLRDPQSLTLARGS